MSTQFSPTFSIARLACAALLACGAVGSARSAADARPLVLLTLMACSAYSTWKRRPSGEKVFTPRS